MKRPLQVGIIGASAGQGWARESHVPAVQGLAGLELGAVVTQNQAQAELAAKAFGARIGYADPQALFDDQAIDIVTIAVKVPDHHALVLGALRAAKHVYCEWPLSPTRSQAEELAVAARTAGVKVAIGLQARLNPAVLRARELIEQGAIGRVLGARCYSTSVAWGGETEPAMVFAEKPDAGVNLVIIQGAHTVDLLISLVGELADASALATRQYPQVAVKGEGRTIARQTFDHLIAHGRLQAGGTIVAEIVGGRPLKGAVFELIVVGERGELALRGGAPRGFQSGRLALSIDGQPCDVDEGELSAMPAEALNVSAVYARLRDDIAYDAAAAPDFAHAVRLTQLIEDLLAASADGHRRYAKHWPKRASNEIA